MRLLRLSPVDYWQYLVTQSASFWFLNIYVFFEYVRPQRIYPAIDVLPWTQSALILTGVAFVLEGNWFRMRTAASWWLTVFSIIVGASIATAYSPKDGIAQLNVFFVWVLVYFLIVNIVNTRERFVVFLTAFMLYNLQMSFGAVKQWASIGFRFRAWGLTGGGGWFNNSGDFGVALCIFLPMSIYFFLAVRPHLDKMWKKVVVASMPVTALMSIVGCSSRGALVGAAAVGLWMLLRTRYRIRGLVAAVVIGAVAYTAVPAEQKMRLSVSGDDETSTNRLRYWRHGAEIMNENPVHGVGYFNWVRYYSENVDARGELPHNLFVLAMAELGYPGIFVLLILMLCVFLLNHRTRKLAARDPPSSAFLVLTSRGLDGGLVGFMAAGFFDTVTWYPFFWFHLAMTVALHVLAQTHPVPAAMYSGPRRVPLAQRRIQPLLRT